MFWKEIEEIEKWYGSVHFKIWYIVLKVQLKKKSKNQKTKILFDNIKSKKIRFEDVKKKYVEFQSKVSSAKLGGNKSNKQLSEIENNTNFSKSREDVIKFSNDYFKMVHKAAYDSKRGKGLKILTLKQMLQRLPIALVQVKVGNTPENLLNELRQIIYSPCIEKKKLLKTYMTI